MYSLSFTATTITLSFRAVLLDDPYARLKAVVRWYLSGFYKKPKVKSDP